MGLANIDKQLHVRFLVIFLDAIPCRFSSTVFRTPPSKILAALFSYAMFFTFFAVLARRSHRQKFKASQAVASHTFYAGRGIGCKSFFGLFRQTG